VTVTVLAVLPDPPYLRAEGETNAAWEAFAVYRDLSPSERSYSATAERLGKARQNVDRWGRQWRWRERAASWDQARDRARVDGQLEAVRRMAERHASQAQAGLQALMVPHLATARKLQLDPEALEALASNNDLASLVALAVRTAGSIPALMNAERLARGEPTEIARQVNIEVDADTRDSAHPTTLGAVLDVLAQHGLLPGAVPDDTDDSP
jgi:hypothetical protein